MGGGWVVPSIDATLIKNGICKDVDVQNEYIRLSILDVLTSKWKSALLLCGSRIADLEISQSLMDQSVKSASLETLLRTRPTRA